MCACGRAMGKLVHYGRSKDRIVIGDTILDAYDIQEAIYSLTPAPDAWKVLEQEEGLYVLLDSHDAGQWSKEDIQTLLSEKLHLPVTIQIITDATLLDRVGLVNNVPSTKPVYIQKRNND
ncbi:hypothetical protein D3C78_1686520 [compost metagenome]